MSLECWTYTDVERLELSAFISVLELFFCHYYLGEEIDSCVFLIFLHEDIPL